MSTHPVDLNAVIPALENPGSSYLEFYDHDGCTRKSLGQLREDVHRAMVGLARVGRGARKRIGILASTEYRWIVVDLACLASGYITVPLDPELRWDSDTLAERFELDAIATNLPVDPANGGRFISFDALEREDAGGSDATSATFADGDPFTVIFTSGTSGEPKAIEVPKRCFDDQFTQALEMFEIGDADKMLVFLPLHVYLERCYVYVAILRGFSLAVTTPRFVLKALRSAGVTFSVGVPHFFQSLRQLFELELRAKPLTRWRYRSRLALHELGLPMSSARPFEPFRRLLGGKMRFLVTGSAACDLPTLRHFHACGIPLYEGYGMSELAGMVALNYPEHVKLGTVGKVFPDKEVRIASNGEILVRSKGGAPVSYWHADADAQAPTFLSDGWIATGDLGHFDGDGFLVIDGRIKDVIVLSNGRKVQPAAIEARLNAIDGVERSIVLGTDRPYLVALLSLERSANANGQLEQGIRALNASLPEADRIRKYRVVDEAFSPENGQLNRAFKLDRSRVKAKYAALIEEVYQA